jgi:L-asparaginase/Glu-tRNA(Gln) amidotransferase subunit D
VEPKPEILLNPKPTVGVVYAGGTISALATAAGYREGGHVVDLVGQLEEHIPGSKDKVTLSEAKVAYTGLSENMSEKYLDAIGAAVEEALQQDPHSIVVTHGTDSMEQTARYLQKRFAEELKAKNSKIIITGANDDISEEDTDAWDNLAFALDSAAGDAEPGVYVAFHDKLSPAELVVKEPFNGVEMNYTSRDNPAYQEAMRKQQAHSQELIHQLEASFASQQQETAEIVDYPVNVVRKNHQGLLDYVGANHVRAILLTLYHSGTANTETPDQSVAELTRKLREEKGIVCFGVTENDEPVSFDSYETSIELREAGIIPLGDMAHDVALAMLRLIEPSVNSEQLAHEMLINRVGELSA